MNRISILVLVVLLPLLLASCGGGEKGETPRAPVAVRTMTVAAVREAATVEASGSLRSGRETVISGKTMGTVTSIRKVAGDPVRKGEVLLVIDSRDVDGQIAQARGALAQAQAAAAIAQTNLQRFEQLFTRNAASQLELDQARYQAETAKGAVTQAEGAVATASSYRSYAEIAAPFDGRVVDRLCEVGDMAAPGRPLMKIEDDRTLRLDVSLSESSLGAAVRGQTVKVRIPALGDRTLDGKVAEVVPAARSCHAFLPRQDRPAQRIRGSAPGSTAVPRSRAAPVRRCASRVPASATAADSRASSWPKAAARRSVSSHSRTFPPTTREVLSGLSDGDRVILDPPAVPRGRRARRGAGMNQPIDRDEKLLKNVRKGLGASGRVAQAFIN